MVYEGDEVKGCLIKSASFFALALWCCGMADAGAQSKAAAKKPLPIRVTMEFIEIEHLDYSDWLLANRLDSDANELRAAVQKWIEKGRGEIVETVICTAPAGQRGKTQSGKGYTYPTEFDPPKIPKKVILSGKETAPITRGKGADPATRHLGSTLEIHPFLDINQITIDLHLVPSIVKLSRNTRWPSEKEQSISSVEMPIFHKMRIITVASAYVGNYTLLGTTRPLKASDPKRRSSLVLQFVRADIAKGKDDAGRK